jgi:protein-L-isoaspartate(D-aspartate) O-methyltransferase
MKQLKGSGSAEKMIRVIMDHGVQDTRVLSALRAVPRDRFMPADTREYAHADKAVPIGHGQTISQPYIVALMTQRLDVQAHHRVLELGTGTGYQTAVLAHLAQEVFTIERVKPLLDEAFERLMDLNIRNAHFKFGDGTLGWTEHAPYDRIMITADAPDLPKNLLLSNLKDGGLAVLPMGMDDQKLVEVRRVGTELRVRDICAVKFVKLIGQEGWKD